MSDAPVIDQPPAADGGRIPIANSFTQFLQLLEDGALHAELTGKLPEISAALSNHVIEYGGKPKATLSLSIDFTLDNGVFEIRPQFSVKLPKPPRSKTVLWSTPQNDFTPANPKQMQMFGVRQVGGEKGPVKTV